MHPVLFRIPVPEFMQGFLPEYLTIYAYGTLIAFGAIMGYLFTAWRAKKELDVSTDKVRDMIIYLILAAFIGGKLFFYFEDPSYYFAEPSRMLKISSGGFVFYGSLLFAIPVMLYYFHRTKLPKLPMLDIMAITATIVHFFGRLGCFFAGCCYGVPTGSDFGIVFSHPQSKAPVDVHLHPTQLYSAGMILTIGLILWYFKQRKRFDGQVFLIYLALYAFGRGIIEIYRGDEARGYIIEGILSHSQFISLLVVAAVIYYYTRLDKRARLRARSKKS